MKGSIERYFTVLKKDNTKKEEIKTNLPKKETEKKVKTPENSKSSSSNSSASRSDASDDEKAQQKKVALTKSISKPNNSKPANSFLSNWTSKYKVTRATHFHIEIQERKLRMEKKEIGPESPFLESAENAVINLAKLSPNERNMFKCYDIKLVDNKLPSFWPQRIWDSDYTQLSKQDSNLLEKKINNIISEYESLKPLENNQKVNEAANVNNNENKDETSNEKQDENKDETQNEKHAEHIIIKRENFLDDPVSPINSSDEQCSSNTDLSSDNSSEELPTSPRESKTKKKYKKKSITKPILFVSTKIFDTDDEYDETDWFDE